jgi:ribonuclease HII
VIDTLFPGGPPLGPGVCGLDEAGRGPLAGPVSAGAAVLPAGFPLEVLDDSKALSAKRREEAYALIVEGALAWSVAWAYPCEIDELNILRASLLAMRRAYLGLEARLRAAGLPAPAEVLVDGNRLPELGRPCAALVRGDAIVPAIMAASILAKVARDRAMERYDWLYPEYGYARHKGYPTAAHRAVCRELGPSPIQRMSFNYRKRG